MQLSLFAYLLILVAKFDGVVNKKFTADNEKQDYTGEYIGNTVIEVKSCGYLPCTAFQKYYEE